MALQGLIEVARPFQVRGWAFVPGSAGPARVELVKEGQVLGACFANLYRDDLAASGIGDGRHGFVINVDQQLPVETLSGLSVRVVTPSGETQDLPFAKEFQVRSETFDRPLRGVVGVFLAHEIRGWAWDPDHPDLHVPVDIRSHGEVVGTVIADMIRPDLARAGIGAGDHGFVFRPANPLPVDEPGAVGIFAKSGSSRYWRLPDRPSPNAAPELQPEPIRPVEFPPLPFPAQAADQAQHPVFILGAARSGTSALAQAISQNTRYAGPGEGHILDLLPALSDIVEVFYKERVLEWSEGRRTLISAIPPDFFTAGIRHIFVELARTKFPTGYWLDKTPLPEMILAAPMLREVWPDAKFIFLRRDPVANIVSGLRKFPTRSFTSLCQNWARSVAAWNTVRAKLEPDCLEIPQETLATRPGDVIPALSAFLRLSPREELRVLQSLETDRPERTSPVFATQYTPESAGWNSEQIAIFNTICGPLIDVPATIA